MSWFKKIAQILRGQPSLEGSSLYSPEQPGEIEGIYQSSDFPHVFLGGEDDLERVKEIVDQPICRVIDVSKSLPEFPIWNVQQYDEVRNTLIKLVNAVAAIIENYDCPIFIHCKMGANRSVSVLAAAIAKLTDRSVMDVLREIKSQRGIASPHDVYLDMISQSYEQNPETRKDVRETLEIA